MTASTIPLRAALYLRVSTARQAEHDVSIPDQKRQGEAYCEARGLQLVETFVEPGASATNDRRPEFQRMIEAGTSKPAPFDIVVVHSFSRFFRDHFALEFYVRKLAKNGVKLVSITQEMGDDPMHVMMRHIMALSLTAKWTSQFIDRERIGPGGDDQFAKLLHLAGFEFPRLVFQRLQFRVEVPWLAY